MVEIVVAGALGKRTTDVERSRELLAWVNQARGSRTLMKRSKGNRMKEGIYRFSLRDHREALEKIRELLVTMPL
jgi:hypothetical protein